MQKQNHLNTFPPIPQHFNFKDITGRKYNLLSVTAYAGKSPNGKFSMWQCLCDCGNLTILRRDNFVSGQTKSCGCVAKPHGHTKSGNKRTPTYKSFEKAKERCRNPNSINYRWYGGQGVEFRFTSFNEFLSEVGERPGKEFTIDRIDPFGHYEKGNIRWATKIEQSNNQRNKIKP